MIWFLLVLDILVTFRVTRLVVEDDFPPILAARKRVALARPTKTVVPLKGEPFVDFWWLGQLITCPWCASAYVAAGATAITWAFYDLPLPIFFGVAVWGGGAALASKL